MKWLLQKYEHFELWAVRAMQSKYAFPVLFLVTFLENIISPLPGDVLVAPLAARPEYTWKSVVFVATTASMLGACVTYFIGAFFYQSIGAEIIAFYNLETLVGSTQNLYIEYGLLAVFIAGFTPIPDKLLALICGALQVSLLPFAIAIGLGRALRFVVVAFLADKYGRSSYVFIKKELPRIIVFVSLLIIFAFLFVRFAVQ